MIFTYFLWFHFDFVFFFWSSISFIEIVAEIEKKIMDDGWTGFALDVICDVEFDIFRIKGGARDR